MNLSQFDSVIRQFYRKTWILEIGGPDFPSLFVMLEVHFNNEKLQSGVKGGFQLEFVSMSRVINHMTCYNFEHSHW